MKKVEKQDIIKWSSVVLIISVILTWLVSISYFENGSLVSYEIDRVGLSDLTYYILSAFGYVIELLPVVFIVPAFYSVLGSTEAYSKITDAIASKFVDKKKVFVALSILFYACLAGVSSNYVSLFVLIPFTISILAKMKVDKMVGFVSTFGGVLVGVLGATYSTSLLAILGDATYGLGLSYGYDLVSSVVIFALAYILLTYFTFTRLDKEVETSDLLEDSFATYVEEVKNDKKGKKIVRRSASALPMVITLGVVFLIAILAFIGWEKAFGISIFADIHTWITKATLFNQPIYSYILGDSFVAFGSWELMHICAILVIATFVIKVLYRIPFDKLLEHFINGLKLSVKPLIALTLIYTVAFINVQFHPIISYFVDGILSLGNNVFTVFFSGALSSIFTVEFRLAITMIGNAFTSFKDVESVGLALQAGYGFISFIAPTSVMLMLGLSTLNIKFKDYFKFIWKFLIAILVLIFVILLLL